MHRHSLNCAEKEIMYEIDAHMPVYLTHASWKRLRDAMEQAVVNGLYNFHKHLGQKRGRHER